MGSWQTCTPSASVYLLPLPVGGTLMVDRDRDTDRHQCKVAAGCWPPTAHCALLAGFYPCDPQPKGPSRRPQHRLMRRAQMNGESTTRALFDFYGRKLLFSEPLVQLVDGMLSVDPTRRS